MMTNERNDARRVSAVALGAAAGGAERELARDMAHVLRLLLGLGRSPLPRRPRACAARGARGAPPPFRP